MTFTSLTEKFILGVAPEIALRGSSKEVREELVYIGVFATKNQVVKTSKENPISQIKEFSMFLYMGRCRSLGSVK